MRLLKFDSHGELSLPIEFIEEIPRYAILSHTWGADDDEVTYNDLKIGSGKSKAGYAKIQFCINQAEQDGLQYFWVDTCCIDKANHAELSEAIVSMFRWYRDAVKCYVYLSDVSVHESANGQTERTWESAFRKSRWFTRGWTLQELIAPESVEFFSREGQRLGDRNTLEQQIHEITEVPIMALRGTSLSHFTVHERMRWASKRHTKRKEDQAYCLLGIFNVFMTPLYGEEENAFIRLNDEIDRSLKRSLKQLPYTNGAILNAYTGDHISNRQQAQSHYLKQSASGQFKPGREVTYYLGQLNGHKDKVTCVAFSPDGTTIASSSTDGSVRVWDAATGRQLLQLKVAQREVNCVAFSPDGTTIASGSTDESLRAWDAATGRQLRQLGGPYSVLGKGLWREKLVDCLAFSPDGTVIAYGTRDKPIRVRDVATGRQLRQINGASLVLDEVISELTGHKDKVSCVAFSPDGTTIASGSNDKSVKVWDTATWRRLLQLNGHKAKVTSVAFSPDGTTIASSSIDESVRVWDVATGRELRQLNSHNGPVTCVAFSPDGTIIASSGSWDKSVRVWDAITGRQLQQLDGHQNWVSGVAFSPDGTTIASSSWDKSVRVWKIAVR